MPYFIINTFFNFFKSYSKLQLFSLSKIDSLLFKVSYIIISISLSFDFKSFSSYNIFYFYI